MKLSTKYLATFFLILLFAAPVFPQGNSKEKFMKGVDSFSASNYKDALNTWLDIYNTGYRSAGLYYNIGNAYFKLNDIPNAILFYERAYLLKPSDENIKYNLEIARAQTVDRFQTIPRLFYSRWYDFVSLILSSNTWAVISLTLFIISLIMISLYIYSSRYDLKVAAFWMGVSFLIISGASLAFSFHNKSLVFDSRGAIIASPVVSGKSSPDVSGTDLFVLHEGTKVTIGDKVGDWYEIMLSDGNKGWVPENSLNKI
jgi:tetratricopeptide (TPR) repeat protein